ncbi:restriction endonuclease subunit S [Alkalihalobacillus oceani]|uniref:Restriction endonuclease subunit S n=1 Tax=Halalkalibacter oceani TaxID=1653776 RepID=A0A9X2DKN4_9BACI|nr:restriction endonuclease subunit S [Halalkalibacter oceani]MCM3712466.1 restriction endonuclease subunit S [Halalkalibacter oceani]
MAVWSTTTAVELSKNNRIDSEFFHPGYLASEDKVVNSIEYKKLGELGKFLIGPFGSAFHVSNYDPKSKYRYIRGKDVKPFTLLDDDNVYMPEKDYKRLVKYAVMPDDLLISVVGTLGNVAIVPQNIEGIFSCKSTVFRDSIIDPYYLLAYFNSKYGRDCLLRRQRGAIQTGLNKDDLKTVPVPIYPKEEKNIADLVRSSLELATKSKDIFVQAQQVLEKALGLAKLHLKKTKCYEANYGEIVSGSRVDAEFYHPHSKEIYELDCFNKSVPLKEMFTILRGQTPSSYFKEGIPVLKTKNIRTPIIDESKINDFVNNSGKYITTRMNDLIIASMGVGSLGRISYVFEESTNAIIDGTLRILRFKEGYELDIIPTLLFLTSSYGQVLIYQGIVGSTGIISLPDYHLRNIKIPILDSKIARSLTSLVLDGYNLKKESERLIREAVIRVENLIEEVI